MPVIADLSLTLTPATALYTAPVPDVNITASETTSEGRNAVVLDFFNGDGLYSRDLGTIFSWPMSARTVLYVWQPSIIPMPEGIYDRAEDWDFGGTMGDKFIQGLQIEADTSGVAKTFFLQDSDTLAMHALNEMPFTFAKQTSKSFSCVTPFIAHSARVISTDGVSWRVWQSKLVFQPFPSSCVNWQTEMTSLGFTGWGHVRETNIAHISTADLTLVLTFDFWPTITLTIPNSAGLQQKTKVTLPANKFKLLGLRVFSTAPFRLFEEDVELKAKAWGSQGPYTVLKPYGGKSSMAAIV